MLEISGGPYLTGSCGLLEYVVSGTGDWCTVTTEQGQFLLRVVPGDNSIKSSEWIRVAILTDLLGELIEGGEDLLVIVRDGEGWQWTLQFKLAAGQGSLTTQIPSGSTVTGAYSLRLQGFNLPKAMSWSWRQISDLEGALEVRRP